MRTAACVLAGAMLCSTAQGLQRITTQRIYEVKADVPEHLPRIEVGKGTEMMGVRDVARMVHAGESDVTLVGTGFAVDLAPLVEPGAEVYTARFCSLEHGELKPELEHRLPAAGGRVVFTRSRAGKNYVLVINDFLAPETLDIVAVQEKLYSEMTGPPSEEAGRIMIFIECSRQPAE